MAKEQKYMEGVVESVEYKKGNKGYFLLLGLNSVKVLEDNELIDKPYKTFRYGEGDEDHKKKMRDELEDIRDAEEISNRIVAMSVDESEWKTNEGEARVSHWIKSFPERINSDMLEPEVTEETVEDTTAEFTPAKEVKTTKKEKKQDTEREIENEYFDDMIKAFEITDSFATWVEETGPKFEIKGSIEFWNIFVAVFNKYTSSRYHKKVEKER